MTILDEPVKPKEDGAADYARRGEECRLKEEYEKAIRQFTHATELDGNNSWVLACRGETYRMLERNQRSLSDLNSAIKLDENNDWAIASRGMTYLALGKYERGLVDFNRAIEINPENLWAIARRGEAYHQLHNYEQALVELNHVLTTDAQNAWAFLLRGQVYLDMSNYTKAAADFTCAIELDRKNASTVANRGESWHHMEAHEQALNAVNRARAFASRGVTYRLMRKYKEAVLDFDHAIELSENYAWALANRGVTYYQMEKYDHALPDLNRAINQNGKDDWALAYRGELHRLLGKYNEALSDFNQAIRLKGQEAWVISARGETLRLLNRYNEALADFDRALEMDEKSDWALASRGETYRALGKTAEALSDFNRAIELNAKNPWAKSRRDNLLAALEKKYAGNLEEVKKEFEEGNFLGALGLPPEATPPEIIDRITDRMEEYQSVEYRSMRDKQPLLNELVRNLNMVQEALTTRSAEYLNACNTRDRVFEMITAKHGPVAVELFKKDIWKQIWELGFARSSAPRVGADNIIADVERNIATLPDLKIGRNEIRNGKAKRSLILQKEDCKRCRGTRQISLSGWEVVDEAMKNKQLFHDLNQNGFPLEELVRQRKNNPYVKKPNISFMIPCPACVSEVVFVVPAEVRKGSLLRTEGGKSAHYARISAIVTAVRTHKPVPLFLEIWVKTRALGILLLCYIAGPIGTLTNLWYVNMPSERGKTLALKGWFYLSSFVVLGLEIWGSSAGILAWWREVTASAGGFAINRFFNTIPSAILWLLAVLIAPSWLFAFGRGGLNEEED